MKKYIYYSLLLFLPFLVQCQKVVPLPGGQRIAQNLGVPIVSAGSDQSIELPDNDVDVSGSATSPNGAITDYLWTRVSGPNTPTITTPTSASTSITGLIAGTYVFRLTATDEDDISGTDDVSIVVASETSYGDTVFVYIAMGQSNADGRATDSFPYANGVNQVPGVQIFNWPDRTMRPFEYDRYNGSQSPGSPRWWGGDIVVKKVFDSLRGGGGADSVVYFKCTQGGTSIGPATIATGNWIIPQDSTLSGKAKMSDSLVNRWTAFKALWNSRGYYVKPIVIMWHQGESDYLISGPYYTRMHTLFTFFREDVFLDSDLPIVMGNIVTYSDYYNATIRAAHNTIATAMSNVYLINLEGQPLKSDNDHFGATGQTYFGNQMYLIIKTFAR